MPQGKTERRQFAGKRVMSRIEESAVDVDETSTENTIKFVLTLIVTTVIAAVAVYALGVVVLDSREGAPAHRAAIAAMHAHS